MQTWVSLQAEAVRLITLGKRSYNHTLQGGYRNPELGSSGGAEGRGKRPQTWAAGGNFQLN